MITDTLKKLALEVHLSEIQVEVVCSVLVLCCLAK